MDTSASELAASWLCDYIKLHGRAHPIEVATYIETTFGADLIRTNESGRPSVASKVLARFRTLAEPDVVWDQSLGCWRSREPADTPGAWKQSGHAIATDLETGEYITAYTFRQRFGRDPTDPGDAYEFDRMTTYVVRVEEIDVAGHSRQAVLRGAAPTSRAALVREPDSQLGPSAIAVYVNRMRIGYVDRPIAEKMAPIIDSREWSFVVPLVRIQPAESGVYSAQILIEVRRGSPDSFLGDVHLP